VLLSATTRSPSSAVESIVVQPRMDTAKTPKPKLVTVLSIAHELKISLTEFYFYASRLNLPFHKVRNDVVVDREATLAALRGRFDVGMERTPSVCALFWTGTRRRNNRERARHLRQFLSGIEFKNEKAVLRIRGLVERARLESNRKMDDQAALVVTRLLCLGTIFEDHVDRLQKDKKTERATFEQLRKIQAYAWGSIAAFDKGCRQHNRVVGFVRFKKAMLHFAARRLALFDKRPILIREKSAALEAMLKLMSQYAAAREIPEEWGRLIERFRAFFFESDPKFPTRDAVKVKGRIRNYAGRRGLRDELDVFNVTSFLRLVLGWTAEDANAFAGWIVFQKTASSEDGNAQDTAKKYRQRFKRRFSLWNGSPLSERGRR
jgi:hypothetical protein